MAEKKPAKKAVKKASSRTSAVKKTTKKTARKTAAKRTTLKKTATKKTTNTRAPKTVRKVTRRASSKENTAKDESIKSPYSSEVENDEYPNDTVSVPRTASPRLQERAALLHFIADRDVDAFVVRMAKVVGVFCLMFGLITSSSALFAEEMILPGSQQTALTVLTKQSEFTESSTTTDPNDELLNITAADIDIIFDIDNVLSDEHELRIESSHGSYVDAYLKSNETGTYHPFDMYDENIANREWRYVINVGQLPEGAYTVKAKVHIELTNDLFEIVGPQVMVEHPVDNSGSGSTSSGSDDTVSTTVTAATEPDTTLDETPDGTLEPIVEFLNVPDVIDGTESIKIQAIYADSLSVILRDKARSMAVRLTEIDKDSLTDTYVFKLSSEDFVNGEFDLLARVKVGTQSYNFESDRFEIFNEEPEEVVDDTDDTLVDETAVVTETTQTEPAKEPVAVKPVVRMVYDTIRSTERYRIYKIEAASAKFVELYAKPYVGTTPKFLGLATRLDTNTFTYAIDTTQLPNGRYLVSARASINGALQSSEPVEMRVENQAITQTKSTDTTTTAVKEPEPDSSITKIVTEVEAEKEAEVATVAPADFDTTTNISTKQYADELLARFKADIETALQRYTTALRSGDETAIARAKRELDALREKMLLSVLNDELVKDYLAVIELEINRVIAELKSRTVETERIIKERTEDRISIDSDGDGITDYDEINLYGTDPNEADTDKDGFIDGAEIMSGFDPKNDAYEAIIEYESPQSSGVVREDILTVESVQTIVDAESDVEKPARAEIRGKALPNSFVTLYIFSTPVIVTVKTADDGSWSYTFDKELEDGSHEVYVGITDNSGRIVAKSNPFQFVKEAQAFTPVDASSGGTIAPTTPDKPLSSPFTTPLILGLTLLVVGLMLIMLGRYLDSMRKEEETVIPQPA